MADESQRCRVVFQEYEHSVVRLNYNGRFMGTGFVVHWSNAGRKCLIMTCAHVCRTIPTGRHMDAFFSGSIRASKAAVVTFGDQHTDLGLLYVTYMDPVVRARGDVAMGFFEQPVAEGCDVVLLGFQQLRGHFILNPSTWPGRLA
jgi:hypothetical protein